jgi:hypothetical protein
MELERTTRSDTMAHALAMATSAAVDASTSSGTITTVGSPETDR